MGPSGPQPSEFQICGVARPVFGPRLRGRGGRTTLVSFNYHRIARQVLGHPTWEDHRASVGTSYSRLREFSPSTDTSKWSLYFNVRRSKQGQTVWALPNGWLLRYYSTGHRNGTNRNVREFSLICATKTPKLAGPTWQTRSCSYNAEGQRNYRWWPGPTTVFGNNGCCN